MCSARNASRDLVQSLRAGCCDAIYPALSREVASRGRRSPLLIGPPNLVTTKFVISFNDIQFIQTNYVCNAVRRVIELHVLTDVSHHNVHLTLKQRHPELI